MQKEEKLEKERDKEKKKIWQISRKFLVKIF